MAVEVEPGTPRLEPWQGCCTGTGGDSLAIHSEAKTTNCNILQCATCMFYSIGQMVGHHLGLPSCFSTMAGSDVPSAHPSSSEPQDSLFWVKIVSENKHDLRGLHLKYLGKEHT